MEPGQAFRGPRRKIVLAFDLGTTYSGISYTVLDPGVVPEIKSVTRFPSHEQAKGASKIPTVIYYDRDGKVRAVGAEAMKEGIYEQAEDEEWTKAEWFKLHLGPKIARGADTQTTNIIPPLPRGKTVVDVFADFLAYLYDCAGAYIQDTHANGAILWHSAEGQIDFVLSHPNGWGGAQQNEMREAAIQAGLVPDTATGHARLVFITEGEASLHYAIQNGLPDDITNAREGVVIVDAGGGTIDISSYGKISTNTFEEIAAPQCHFSGSVFVNFSAQEFLAKFLEESLYLDDLHHIVHCFDQTTKLKFRSATEAQYIKFGTTRDNDPLCNIRYGQLKLEGPDVASFFAEPIRCTVQSVIGQRNMALQSISHVVFVGGFSASDWVYSQVSKALTPLGLHIMRPDNQVNKAVSDGAILSYMHNHVTKLPHGPSGTISNDPSNSENVVQNSVEAFVPVSGTKYIRDPFIITQIFQGSRRKIVLAFDVGTTYSGISYSVLDPGVFPEIKGVTRFPTQEHATGASKIPTIIYYDRGGRVRAVGAAAMQDGIYEQAEDEEWTKAEWFKLHLRPNLASGAGKQVTDDIPSLPPGKTVVDVFADFLTYLYQCAASYIMDTEPNGALLWDSVEGQIDFVLSHPNGWEGTQQNKMRKAAIQAGLVPDTATGHARLSFVTEGEASLHYAIQNGLGAANTEVGVVIVDAGGGTIDVSSYISASQHTFEEIAAPQCHFNGSVFVSISASEFLADLLEESDYIDDLEHITRWFDKTTKLKFRSDKEAQYIKFGSAGDNDPACKITHGSLKLEGSDVALFFEKSVNCIIQAVKNQRDTALKSISHVVVGGFSANDWVYDQVNKKLTPLGLHIMRPDNYVNKAVSDGAISFYLDHFVASRVAKVTYGYFNHIPYRSSDPDHVARKHTVFVSLSGNQRITGSFDVILPKNTQVSEIKEFRRSYLREYESQADSKFRRAFFAIWCYHGDKPNPKWMDIDTDRYTNFCTIEIDLSPLPLRLTSRPDASGVYYVIAYEIVLQFGLTELKAQIAWVEDGFERRSPVRIVYNTDTSNF